MTFTFISCKTFNFNIRHFGSFLHLRVDAQMLRLQIPLLVPLKTGAQKRDGSVQTSASGQEVPVWGIHAAGSSSNAANKHVAFDLDIGVRRSVSQEGRIEADLMIIFQFASVWK